MSKPFVKNDPRINKKGRPVGSKNRSIEQLRMALFDFVNNNMETIQKDFDALEPKDRLAFLERLLKHVLPPMVTSLEQLSENDLDILLDALKRKSYEQN